MANLSSSHHEKRYQGLLIHLWMISTPNGLKEALGCALVERGEMDAPTVVQYQRLARASRAALQPKAKMKGSMVWSCQTGHWTSKNLSKEDKKDCFLKPHIVQGKITKERRPLKRTSFLELKLAMASYWTQEN